MQPYNSKPDNWKASKNKTHKINFRLFGSTHKNDTKKRIIRWGKRAARKQAKEEILEELEHSKEDINFCASFLPQYK